MAGEINFQDVLSMDDDEIEKQFADDDETTDENADTNDGEGNVDPTEALKDMEERIAALTREKDGFMKGMKDERRKRQEFQGRFDQLSQTVNAILEQRTKQATADTGDTKKLKGVPVEFDEDGNAFLPAENMQAMLTPYQKKIMELEQRLSATSGQIEQKHEENKVIQQILSEDEQYPTAYRKYQAAREWANQKVIDFQLDNNLQGPMTPEQALDYVFDETLETEFTQAFPGADLEAVIGNSKRAFRKALKSFKVKPTEEPIEKPIADKKTPDSRFQKVLQKPSGLGNAKNSKSTPPVTERVGQLSHQDIMSLNDADIAALQEAMLQEEKSDGIIFK